MLGSLAVRLLWEEITQEYNRIVELLHALILSDVWVIDWPIPRQHWQDGPKRATRRYTVVRTLLVRLSV